MILNYQYRFIPRCATVMSSSASKLDKIGFSASFFCAIHCALMPIVAGLLPLFGLQFLAKPAVEHTFFVIAFIIASLSLFPGYFRHHRKLHALAICITGFSFIIVGHLMSSEWIEWSLVVVGALGVAAAHLVNYHECKNCPKCHDGECCSAHPKTT